MTALLLAPVYLLLHLYLLLRLLHWLGAFHRRLSARWVRLGLAGLFLMLAAAPLGGFLVSTGGLHRIFKVTANFWMGAFLYALLIVSAADLICLVIRRLYRRRGRPLDRARLCRRAGGLALAAVCLVSLYGVIHARQIRVEHRSLTVQKSCALPSLRVALIADLHLGYGVGNGLMEQMVEKLNRENVDIVCLAGDIFDNEYDAIHEPERVARTLAGIRSRYGVYACWGNHDVPERVLAGFTFVGKRDREEDPRYREFLQKANIRLLQDESVCIDDAFYLAGRRDRSRARKMGESRLSPEELLRETDGEKPILVMDHQPRELEALAAAGADLTLSGHTHDGQLFPGNLLVRLLYDNAGGVRRTGGMLSCVTSGVGVWGPAMRVGTHSEILILDLAFTGPAADGQIESANFLAK